IITHVSGFSDITKPQIAYFVSYIFVFSFFVIIYIPITRSKLLSILREKAGHMSEKTRRTHHSLAQALTIHAVLPIVVTIAMIVLTVAQETYDLHSITIERLEFDFAIMPALVNPVLILYFVQPYRM
ncbi:hypothetical protein PENTCL1PPCAC_896, partial [Pristionchus entomophagus]